MSNSMVLIINCGDNHFQELQNQNAMQNGILDTVKNELKMDHFYAARDKMVLVRVDENTINNPVLNLDE